MRLYLVQHGEAMPAAQNPDRPLTERGRGDIARLATFLAHAEVTVAEIVHSGKLRAEQTAEILAPLLGEDGACVAADGLQPNDTPMQFLARIDTAAGDRLVAGHMPFVARTVSQALTGCPDHRLVDFRPGSIAILEHGASGEWCLVTFARPGFF